MESLTKITHYIQNLPSATSIGIFAGNDETAIAVLWALRGHDAKNTFVVGCDSTREMRLMVRDSETPAIATIDTKVGDQAAKTIQAIQKQVREFQEPKLYPDHLDIDFKTLLRTNPDSQLLWVKAR